MVNTKRPQHSDSLVLSEEDDCPIDELTADECEEEETEKKGRCDCMFNMDRDVSYQATKIDFDDLANLAFPITQPPRVYAATISSLAASGRANDTLRLLSSFRRRQGDLVTEVEEMYTSAIYAQKFVCDPDTAERVLEDLKARVAYVRTLSESIGNTRNAVGTVSTVSIGSGGSTVSGGRESQPPPVGQSLQLSIASYNALLAVLSSSDVLLGRQEKVTRLGSL